MIYLDMTYEARRTRSGRGGGGWYTLQIGGGRAESAAGRHVRRTCKRCLLTPHGYWRWPCTRGEGQWATRMHGGAAVHAPTHPPTLTSSRPSPGRDHELQRRARRRSRCRKRIQVTQQVWGPWHLGEWDGRLILRGKPAVHRAVHRHRVRRAPNTQRPRAHGTPHAYTYAA